MRPEVERVDVALIGNQRPQCCATFYHFSLKQLHEGLQCAGGWHLEEQGEDRTRE